MSQKGINGDATPIFVCSAIRGERKGYLEDSKRYKHIMASFIEPKDIIT
jgi:hypothetical protein